LVSLCGTRKKERVGKLVGTSSERRTKREKGAYYQAPSPFLWRLSAPTPPLASGKEEWVMATIPLTLTASAAEEWV